MSVPSPDPASFVIVLVHGTWARDALWTTDGSQFRKALVEAVGTEIVFDPFLWSGANTHDARLEGGESLATRIRELRSKHPTAPVFVVAHSHGGNVALYAMRDDDARRIVSGLVCMATPFITVVARDAASYFEQRRTGIMLAALLITALIVVSLASIPMILTLRFVEHPPDWLGFITLIYPLFFALSRLGTIFNWVTKHTTGEDAVRATQAAQDRLSLPVLRDVPVAVVATHGGVVGDEALFHLTWFRRIISATFLIWDRRIPNLMFCISALFGTIAILLNGQWSSAAFFLLNILMLCLLPVGAWYSRSSSLNVGFLLFFQSIVASSRYLHGLFFGRLKTPGLWLVDVRADATAEAVVPNAKHIPCYLDARSGVAALRHSMVYEHPSTQKQVGLWIKSVAESRYRQ